MNDRRRLFALAAVMFVVSMLIAGIAMSILYQTALARQRNHLTELAQGQAQLVKSAAGAGRAGLALAGEAAEVVNTQISGALGESVGFGRTGGFVVARRAGGRIVVLHRSRSGESAGLGPLPHGAAVFEPMRRALDGQSGTMEGVDDRGVPVLAAYTAVAGLDVGVVGKIDMAEFRRPFLWAGLLVFTMALAFVGTGILALFTVGRPFVGKLEAGEARFRNITQSAGDGIISTDADGAIVSWNRGAADMFGYTETEMLGQPLTRIIPGRCRESPNEAMQRRRFGENGHRRGNSLDVFGLRKDGTEFPVEVTTSRWIDGENWYFAAIVRDVTERERAAETFRKLSQAVEQSPASVIITDTKGDIEYVNPKFVEVTGYDAADVVGRNPRLLNSGETPPETYEDLWRTITAGREWRGELRNRKKNGEVFWELASISPIKSADGTLTHYLAVKEDLTDRKSYERALHIQANYDTLTELPNRALAMDCLSAAIARARRHRRKAALLFIDLDDFKAINNSLGHETGDTLLQSAARRVVACVRNDDTVARMGGDEFTVILPDLKAAVDVEPVTIKILSAFADPFIVEGHELFITPSIGITICPDDGDTPQVLMKNADAAMYRAKRSGHNNFRFFTPEMNDHMVRRRRIETHLRHALSNNEFNLYYQPVVDVGSNTIIGAEALLRWRSPSLGFMLPDQFIPLAEATGMIDSIGDWVLDEACRQLRSWLDEGLPLSRISANVSGRQFRRTLLYESVYRALEGNRVDPGRLELEITESVILEDVTENLAKVHDLKNLGVRIAIDDFGTGYSSLRYLKQFRVDALKIDKSFVRDVATNTDDATIVRAVINLARNLNLEAIAEGVETVEQQEFLRASGCTVIQGYLVSKPLPPWDFADFVRAWTDDAGSRLPAVAPRA